VETTTEVVINTILVLTNTFSGEAYVHFAPYADLLNKSEGEEVRKMCKFFDFLVSEQEKEYQKYLFAPWEKETSEYPYMMDKMDKDVSMVDRLTLFALSEYVANSKTSNWSPISTFWTSSKKSVKEPEKKKLRPSKS